MSKSILICLLSLYSICSSAQLNLKVGYLGLRADLENTNKVFKTFDSNNSLDKNYGSVHYLQGLDIGLRYKWNKIGVEGGWSNIQSSKIDAIGSNYSSNWRISSSEFYAGIENYIGNFGFGISAGYNTMRYKQSIDGLGIEKLF